MASDRERILAGVRRAVPARYDRGLDAVQDAIGPSFGGFVRGQTVMGIMYGVVAFVACVVLGVPYAPLVGVTVALLQTIPYFGQYVSWAPPVVAAWLSSSDWQPMIRPRVLRSDRRSKRRTKGRAPQSRPRGIEANVVNSAIGGFGG